VKNLINSFKIGNELEEERRKFKCECKYIIKTRVLYTRRHTSHGEKFLIKIGSRSSHKKALASVCMRVVDPLSAARQSKKWWFEKN
jgi:hypothetical protein